MSAAMFNSVEEFATFNSKPHLFTYGEPKSIDGYSVIITMTSGDLDVFKSRVEQFGGFVFGEGF